MRSTLAMILISFSMAGCNSDAHDSELSVPQAIQRIFDKPLYQKATWGLHVVDLASNEVIYALNEGRQFGIGSVRKLFSVGLALEALGSGYQFRTPVYKQGHVDASGTLHGDLILVASGDLAMGGRTQADGRLAITNFDHNEANDLGNAQLATSDPLAGFKALAQQVQAAGIARIAGEVIIDARLWQAFNFRGQFQAPPIFVNDDVIDVVIQPGQLPSQAPQVDWRPKSAAFKVSSTLKSGAPGSPLDIALNPPLPACIGTAACRGEISGILPDDFVPPLTGSYPLLRTFRITEPADYARSVFIEALEDAGVTMLSASVIANNPVERLPSPDGYAPSHRVAELVSPPYRDYAKWINKVSYNLGADSSLMMLGLWHKVDNMADALSIESSLLVKEFGLAAGDFAFIDGSGGGFTKASSKAVVQFLAEQASRPTFTDFFSSLPILAKDGSLAFVGNFTQKPELAGARGKVFAKTGTHVTGTEGGQLWLEAQSYAGYIDTRAGRRLAYSLVVNDVGLIQGVEGAFEVFQDQGEISAILWNDH